MLAYSLRSIPAAWPVPYPEQYFLHTIKLSSSEFALNLCLFCILLSTGVKSQSTRVKPFLINS